jgi:aldehyde dehydrogenase (NAD+)
VIQSLNLVGGEWLDSEERIEIRDPSDLETIVGTVPAMSAEEIGSAYRAAATGARTWRSTSSVDRGRVLLRAAGLLRERQGQIAAVLTAEMGKTLAEATVEVGKSADFFEYFGGLGRADRGQLLAHERSDVEAFTVHEPLGVVLAITPWNDPLLTPARKLAPALIAGNSIVLKPASDTPLVAHELARCLDDAGVPAGVVNTVTGRGAEIGDALLADPALAAVSFTGSNEVGLGLGRALAEREIPLLAELGGKNAAVVLRGAQLDRALDTIAAAAFAQAGQRCTATSRVVAERPIAEAVVDGLAERARALAVGPGSAPTTVVGPLVSRSQQGIVGGFVERAVTDGARLAAGGVPGQGDGFERGCYYLPTVLAEVDPGSEIWVDEVFGPVIAVVGVADEAEALTVVNGSPYGLAAALYSQDLGAVSRFVDGAEVGQVAVNLPTSGWDVHMPFGGFKASGSGHKEQGVEGLEFYRRTKTVAIANEL